MVCRSATLSIVCASLNPRWTFAQWQVGVDQIGQPERAERHTAAVALYSMNYDFHRPRKSLRGRTHSDGGRDRHEDHDRGGNRQAGGPSLRSEPAEEARSLQEACEGRFKLINYREVR